jgi:hypothetical protein
VELAVLLPLLLAVDDDELEPVANDEPDDELVLAIKSAAVRQSWGGPVKGHRAVPHESCGVYGAG